MKGTPYKIHIEGYTAEPDPKTGEWTIRKKKTEAKEAENSEE